MKNKSRIVLLIIFLVFWCTLFAGSNTVCAANTIMDKNFLQVTGYAITNETIVQGKDFDLTLSITNFSNKYKANNIIVSVNNPEGVVPEYGNISICHIDSIDPQQTQEVKFKYTANTILKSSELNFAVSVSSNECSSAAQIRVKVGKKTDFDVKEYYLPKEFTVGKTEVLSAYIENIGGGSVNNAIMKAKVDGIEVGATNIGTMSPGTTKTEYVSFGLMQEGNYNLDLVLNYTSTDGTEKEFTIASSKIGVTQPIFETDVDDEQNTDGDGKETGRVIEEGNNLIVICISGILLIIVCCVILLLVYRRN